MRILNRFLGLAAFSAVGLLGCTAPQAQHDSVNVSQQAETIDCSGPDAPTTTCQGISACENSLIACLVNVDAGRGELNATGFANEVRYCGNDYSYCIYALGDNGSGGDPDGDGDDNGGTASGVPGNGLGAGAGGVDTWCSRVQNWLKDSSLSDESVSAEMSSLGCVVHNE